MRLSLSADLQRTALRQHLRFLFSNYANNFAEHISFDSLLAYFIFSSLLLCPIALIDLRSSPILFFYIVENNESFDFA